MKELLARWPEPEQILPRRVGDRNALGRLVGMELEFAGSATQCWDVFETLDCVVDEDGSLPSAGREIRTPPAAGDAFLRLVDGVGEAAYTSRVWCSNACGFHVHVDARDFGAPEVRRLLALYRVWEPMFYAACPPHRADNVYSKPLVGDRGRLNDDRPPTESRLNLTRDMNWQRSVRVLVGGYRFEDAHHFQGVLGTKKYRDFWRQSRGRWRSRYFGMNLNSLALRGTIEFRMQTGTCESDVMQHWAQGCAWFVEAASTQSDARIAELAEAPSWGAVAPPETAEWFAAGGASELNNSGWWRLPPEVYVDDYDEESDENDDEY